MKLKPIKELQNLCEKDKKTIFGLFFSKLSITCHYLDTHWMNPKQCEGYVGAEPHVSFNEERIQTIFGCSNDMMKDGMSWFKLHDDKFLINYFKKFEKDQEKKRIKQHVDNIKILKKAVEDNSELIKYETEMIKRPSTRIPLFYGGAITDFRLTEYGLRPGVSLGGEWHSFTIVKYKGKYISAGAMDLMTLMSAVEKQIENNTKSTLEQIEMAMTISMMEHYKLNPHIKKQFV